MTKVTPADALNVLGRVSIGKPLRMPDRDRVIAVIDAGLLHVDPVFSRTDPCPYHLTDKGRRALAKAEAAYGAS